MALVESIIEQFIQGLGAILVVLPLALAAWICGKGGKK